MLKFLGIWNSTFFCSAQKAATHWYIMWSQSMYLSLAGIFRVIRPWLPTTATTRTFLKLRDSFVTACPIRKAPFIICSIQLPMLVLANSSWMSPLTMSPSIGITNSSTSAMLRRYSASEISCSTQPYRRLLKISKS